MRLDPARHPWMTLPETRKLMAAPASRDMAKHNRCDKLPIVAVISRDKTKRNESRHAD